MFRPVRQCKKPFICNRRQQNNVVMELRNYMYTCHSRLITEYVSGFYLSLSSQFPRIFGKSLPLSPEFTEHVLHVCHLLKLIIICVV